MELWILFGTFTFLLLIGTPVAFCLGVASFATISISGCRRWWCSSGSIRASRSSR
jgi:hypothetical protein